MIKIMNMIDLMVMAIIITVEDMKTTTIRITITITEIIKIRGDIITIIVPIRETEQIETIAITNTIRIIITVIAMVNSIIHTTKDIIKIEILQSKG
jgi:hypothetical protein